MTRVWIDLPRPPEHRTWCVACVAFGRAWVNQEYGEQIRALESDGKDEDFWFKPRSPHLEAAAVRGVCIPMQGWGVLDLCWTHVTGVEVQAVSPLDPRFQQGQPGPPSLLMGR